MLLAHRCQKNRLKSPSPVLCSPLPPRRGLGRNSYSHIFNLNMKEWVPVKGHIEVVLSNSVSTSNWYRSGTKDLSA